MDKRPAKDVLAEVTITVNCREMTALSAAAGLFGKLLSSVSSELFAELQDDPMFVALIRLYNPDEYLDMLESVSTRLSAIANTALDNELRKHNSTETNS